MIDKKIVTCFLSLVIFFNCLVFQNRLFAEKVVDVNFYNQYVEQDGEDILL